MSFKGCRQQYEAIDNNCVHIRRNTLLPNMFCLEDKSILGLEREKDDLRIVFSGLAARE